MSDSDEIFHYWLDYADEPSPCGVNVFVTPYTFGLTDWAQVTCPGCLAARPVVHHWSRLDGPFSCESDSGAGSHHWPKVTCPARLAARPEVTPTTDPESGEPELSGTLFWPEVTCAACLASEKRARREKQIQWAQAAADEAQRQTAERARVLRDANGVLTGRRALLAAETGSPVPQGGSRDSDASDFSPYAVWERATGRTRLYPGPS